MAGMAEKDEKAPPDPRALRDNRAQPVCQLAFSNACIATYLPSLF